MIVFNRRLLFKRRKTEEDENEGKTADKNSNDFSVHVRGNPP